jgi:hypothetical protein
MVPHRDLGVAVGIRWVHLSKLQLIQGLRSVNSSVVQSLSNSYEINKQNKEAKI